MSTPAYLQLVKGGVSFRMFVLKGIVFNSTQGFKPPSMAIKDWREARRYGFHNWRDAFCELSQGFNGEGVNRIPIWVTHTGPKFRNESYADECQHANIKHTGWFCDPDQNSKARGIVGDLTRHRFIAGYELEDSGERVYFDQVFYNAVDAARMADEHARIEAESQFEYNQRASEASGLTLEHDAALMRLRECLHLRNLPCFEYIRTEIEQIICTLRTIRNRLDSEFSDINI